MTGGVDQRTAGRGPVRVSIGAGVVLLRLLACSDAVSGGDPPAPEPAARAWTYLRCVQANGSMAGDFSREYAFREPATVYVGRGRLAPEPATRASHRGGWAWDADTSCSPDHGFDCPTGALRRVSWVLSPDGTSLDERRYNIDATGRAEEVEALVYRCEPKQAHETEIATLLPVAP
jgi:hypothetical protein